MPVSCMMLGSMIIMVSYGTPSRVDLKEQQTYKIMYVVMLKACNAMYACILHDAW